MTDKLSIVRYAGDINQCVESAQGLFIMHSDYDKLVKEHEKLKTAYRTVRQSLINVTESRNWYQKQLDLKVFTGV